MATLSSSLVVRLLDQVTSPAKKVAASLRGIGSAADSINRPGLGQRLASAVEANNKALDATRMRMADAIGGYYVLKRALGAPIKAAVAFESQLEDIAQKAGLPQEKFGELGAAIRKVGRDTTNTSSEIARGVDVLAGMGASADDALGLMPAIGRAATAYKAEIADLAQAGYAALDNLKVPADQFAGALDAMAQAGKDGAFELKDMARYFPALGAAYQGLDQTGVPAVADLAAALQVVRKGTGDSAEAATNLSNILQKINAPLTRKKFAEMGVNLEREMKKAAKAGLTPIEAIAEITSKTLKGNLGKLGDLFQDAQVQKGLRPLIQNIEEYRRIRAEALKAQGVVEEDYQRRLKTAEGAARRWGVLMENISTSVGAAITPAMVGLGEAVTPLLTGLAGMAERFPAITRAVVGATAGLVAFRVAAIGMQFAGLNLKGAALQSALAFTRLGSALGRAGAAAKSAVALQAALGAMSGQRLSGLAKVSVAIRGMVTAIPGMAVIGTVISGIGAALATISLPVWGGIAVGVGLLAAAGATLYKYWDRLSSVVSGVARRIGEELAPVFSALSPILAPIGSLVTGIGDAFGWVGQKISDFMSSLGSLISREVLSDDMKAAWAKSGYDVADAMINSIKSAFAGLVEWFKGLPARIAAAIGRIDLGSLVTFPSLPSWAGGGSSSPTPTPALAGARARGGDVFAGRSYLVGEERPEIFTPARNGSILPNAGSGGSAPSVTVNFSPTINGVVDPRRLVDDLMQEVNRRTRSMMQGIYADV